MNHLKILLIYFALLLSNNSKAQLVSTVAGVLETPGFNDGQALSARFFNPHGIAVDGEGNIYIADRYNHTIRKLSVAGMVSTIAGKAGFSGSQDGQGETARFNEPWGICVSEDGIIYVADTKNNKIRRVEQDGRVKTLAGTGNFGSSNAQGLAATFGNPTGIELDAFGNLYVADHLTHIIRKIDGQGMVTTIAGIPYIPGDSDGVGREAQFWRPYGLTLDNEGNILVADEWNHKIRKVTPAGTVITVAGVGEVGLIDGNADQAAFNYPWDLTVDAENNIYLADGYNYVIRKIDPNGNVSSYAGTPLTSGGVDCLGAAATFSGATSITWDKITGSLFIGDAYNHLVRSITTEAKPSLTLINSTGITDICQGEDFKVRANTNAFNNYAFYVDGILLQNSVEPTFTAPVLEVGTHQIQVEAIWESSVITSNIITVKVTAGIQPDISVVGEMSFYEGDSTILIANGTGDFLWSNGATTQTITVKTSGKYSVQVSDGTTTCAGVSAPVEIVVLTQPVAAEITIEGNTAICAGVVTTLVSSYTTGNQWLKDGWTIPEAKNQTLSVNEAGFYQVQVEDPITGVLLFSEALEITLLANEESLDFEADLTTVQPGETVTFSILGAGEMTCSWDFGDGNNGASNRSAENNSSYQYDNVGMYDVQLFVENEAGCRDTLTKFNYITVAIERELFIPTAFTPNDDGINDRFLVRGQSLQSFNLQIYNQWGGLLFAAQNQMDGWDGWNNGRAVSCGTYTYLITYSLEGETAYLSGHITLIR